MQLGNSAFGKYLNSFPNSLPPASSYCLEKHSRGPSLAFSTFVMKRCKYETIILNKSVCTSSTTNL